MLGIALFALAIVGAVFGTLRIMKRRDRPSWSDTCRTRAATGEHTDHGRPRDERPPPEHEIGIERIEMRVYFLSEPPEDAEYEGVCLSIVDPERVNGMILEGFGRLVDAMQFGDGLWNDRFWATPE